MVKQHVVSRFEGLEQQHQMLRNPPDLALMRDRMHDLNEQLVFTREQFDTYWKYVSNVWSYQSKYIRKADGAETQHWHCRLQPKTWESKKKIKKPMDDSVESKQRSRKIRDGNECDAWMKMVIIDDIFYLERYGDPHTHNLDRIDELKRNDGLRERVEEQVWAQLQPAEIYAALTGAAYMQDGRTQLNDAGGKYISREEIKGWAVAFRRKHPDLRVQGHNEDPQEQLRAAELFLDKNSWEWQRIECEKDDSSKKSLKRKAPGDTPMSIGIVFGQLHRLDTLRKRGRLTLLDSTHKTNFLGWYLYTFMCRDEAGSFIPSCHLLTDGEDSNILAEAILVIKKWLNQGLQDWQHWKPRYFLTDDSAAEQLAIKKAFKGVYAWGGEDEIKHFLCQVHSRRTIDKRIKDAEIRAELYSTLYYHTGKNQAELAVNRAIELAFKIEQRKNPNDSRTIEQMIKGPRKAVCQ